MCEFCPMNKNGICEKSGEKIALYYCEDMKNNYQSKVLKKKKKRLTGREKKEKYKDYMRKLYGYDRGYPAPVYIQGDGRGYIWDSDFDFRHLPANTFYQRTYKGGSYTKYKRTSHKAVRRYQGPISNGNAYRKIYDLWWETF